MPNAERERAAARASTIITLRDIAAAPCLDARLVVACGRFVALDEEVERLYRRTPRGYLQWCRSTSPEREALEAEIARTQARTLIGRLAKAEVALRRLSSGTTAQIPRSALIDFISNANAQESAA
jgi:hypothetical protein